MPRAITSLGLVLLVGALCTAAIPAQDHADAAESPGTLEFIGKNLFSTANGIFHEWQVVDSHLDFEKPENSFAVVEVALGSVDTGIDRRDAHLRNPDFFQVDTYPVATARIHSPQPLASGEDGEPRYAVQIDLDLHGVRKTLEGEVSLASRSPLVFEGSVTIDRTEFQVGPAPSRWNPVTPRRSIPVRFRVEGPWARVE